MGTFGLFPVWSIHELFWCELPVHLAYCTCAGLSPRRGQKSTTHRLSRTHCLFLYGLGAKKGFHVFKWWRGKISWYVKMILHSNAAFRNTVFLKHSWAHSLHIIYGCFPLTWTETSRWVRDLYGPQSLQSGLATEYFVYNENSGPRLKKKAIESFNMGTAEHATKHRTFLSMWGCADAWVQAREVGAL